MNLHNSNLETSIALLWIGEYCLNEELLKDGPDVAPDDEALALELLSTVREGIARLRELGYSEKDWAAQSSQIMPSDSSGSSAPARLRISSDYRIFLPDRGGEELVLPPLLKTVFIFFLKHPEGVEFKQLGLHTDELEQIYMRLSHRSDVDAMKATVQALVEPLGSSIHISRSRLARCLELRLGKQGARPYRIIGQSGMKKMIDIDRTMLEWE